MFPRLSPADLLKTAELGFGFLANTHRRAKLALIRGLLDIPELADYRERFAGLFGRSLDTCPACGGHLVEIAVLDRASRAAAFSCDSP